MSFCKKFGIFYKNSDNLKHKLHDNSVLLGKYSKQDTKSIRKFWGKENGGSFGLGRKSLGSDSDTETWSRLPIPKPGFDRTLLQMNASNKFAHCYLAQFTHWRSYDC